MTRSPEQWNLLRQTDPDAYPLAIQLDEIQRAGGDPRIIDRKNAATPALPAPVSETKEPTPAPATQQTTVTRLDKTERDALIKALSSVIARYVGAEIADLVKKIDLLDSRVSAMAINSRTLQ